MEAFVGSGIYCLYRGRQYLLRNYTEDYDSRQYVVNIRLLEGLSAADFPDALRIECHGEDLWVMIPERLITRKWAVHVFGEWRGVEFFLCWSYGCDNLTLIGTTDDRRAPALGIPHDAYQYYSGPLPADEVVVTRQVEHELTIRRDTPVFSTGSTTSVH